MKDETRKARILTFPRRCLDRGRLDKSLRDRGRQDRSLRDRIRDHTRRDCPMLSVAEVLAAAVELKPAAGRVRRLARERRACIARFGKAALGPQKT